jgi:adenylosuccinate lyase
MASEEILMAAVQAGGDRQDLHEKIRRHSQAAAEGVKTLGQPNDLLNRLTSDASFAAVDLSKVVDAKNFIGRSPQQVEMFILTVVDPIRRRYQNDLGQKVELRV